MAGANGAYEALQLLRSQAQRAVKDGDGGKAQQVWKESNRALTINKR